MCAEELYSFYLISKLISFVFEYLEIETKVEALKSGRTARIKSQHSRVHVRIRMRIYIIGGWSRCEISFSKMRLGLDKTFST